MHGAVDPLFPVVHAKHMAKLIPHAELEIIEGLGHNFEPGAALKMSNRLLRFLQSDQLLAQR
jgi:pimeloyl-ACP methyl ester carboxylesterase